MSREITAMPTRVPLRLAARLAITLVLAICATSEASANDGSLDPRFGDEGIATHLWPADTIQAETTAGAVAPDGDVIAAGLISYPQGVQQRAVTLVRWLADGTPDAGFGNNGVARFDLDPTPSINERIEAVFPRADGSVLMLVGIQIEGMMAYEPLLMSVRADGTADSAYGPGGMRPIDVSQWLGDDDVQIRTATMQPDGKILIGGLLVADNSYSILLGRLLPDASLDTSFSGDGWLQLGGLGDYDWGVESIAVDDLGRILVAGRADGSPDVPALFRVLADGQLDSSFGSQPSDPLLVEGLDGSWYASAVVADKRSVAGGFIQRRIFLAITSNSPRRTQIVGVANDGSIATTFGTDGFVDLTREEGSALETLALQGEQRVIAAGFIDPNGGGSNTDLFIARIDFNGDLDPSFDGNGVVRYPIDPDGPTFDRVAALAVSARRPIVIANAYDNQTPRHYAAALRLRAPGEVFVDGFEE
jgi:uncharacterized delta-60 repeat protein